MRTKNSFSKQVKEEICEISDRPLHQIKALLSAYIRINGSFQISNKETYLILETENGKIAKYIYSLIKNTFHPELHVEYIKNKKLNKTTLYRLRISSLVDEIIDTLDISYLEGKISKNIVYDDETIASYLSGAFLASGSVNSPSTSNYHLELSLNNENYAKWLGHLFARYKNSDFEPKVVERRDKYILYLKKSDRIADFLIMVGAVNSCIEFENVRVDRDFMNNANRLSNFDTANMERTLKVSKEQIKWITYIDEKLGISNIPNSNVRLACKYRLENESYSINDIAKLMSKELDKEISKSAVVRLFKKIENLYTKLLLSK